MREIEEIDQGFIVVIDGVGEHGPFATRNEAQEFIDKELKG